MNESDSSSEIILNEKHLRSKIILPNSNWELIVKNTDIKGKNGGQKFPNKGRKASKIVHRKSKSIYNLGKIRSLLINHFETQDLRDLCCSHDEFRELQLPNEDHKKEEIVRLIVGWAKTRELFGSILEWAKKNNKRGYQEFYPYKYGEYTNFQEQYETREDFQMIHILHLSDIHLGTKDDALQYRVKLEADLKRELGITQLDYLVISGDIANRSTAEEYEAAFDMVSKLCDHFEELDFNQVIITPGNHDLNWDLSTNAYKFVLNDNLPADLSEEKCIPAGEQGKLVRDEPLYQQRFANFSEYFYKKIYGSDYPLDYSEQGILYSYPDDQIVFLALNSCWQIDHHKPYRKRSGIHMPALAKAIDQLQDSKYNSWLKVAIWHHPVTGQEMMKAEFLEQLAVCGFQICMHGHIHEAIEGLYKYDDPRGISIIGAGTFGAPTKQQVSGIPLQYNLLKLDKANRTLTVETRKKEKPDGTWSADARWGDKRKNPKPNYTINLK